MNKIKLIIAFTFLINSEIFSEKKTVVIEYNEPSYVGKKKIRKNENKKIRRYKKYSSKPMFREEREEDYCCSRPRFGINMGFGISEYSWPGYSYGRGYYFNDPFDYSYRWGMPYGYQYGSFGVGFSRSWGSCRGPHRRF